MSMVKAKELVSGIGFPESPRWHGGCLWYLDIVNHSLYTVDLDGSNQLVRTFSDRPSAIDFLPDGTLLVAFSETMMVRRFDDDEVYADLSRLRASGFKMLYDMVVDGTGRAYIGCSSEWNDEPTDGIALVDTDGTSRLATGGCVTTNGLVVTPSGNGLIAAETNSSRLREWTVRADGSLADPRVFADLGGVTPDGICIDSEGAVWCAGLFAGRVVRARPGGSIVDSVEVQEGRLAVAAALGGPEGRHLFVVSAHTPTGLLDSWEAATACAGYVEVAEVETPVGGWPSN